MIVCKSPFSTSNSLRFPFESSPIIFLGLLEELFEFLLRSFLLSCWFFLWNWSLQFMKINFCKSGNIVLQSLD
ncbi:hypothetical protein Hanom_Chr16g01462771 [Helianthus anomalus]